MDTACTDPEIFRASYRGWRSWLKSTKEQKVDGEDYEMLSLLIELKFRESYNSRDKRHSHGYKQRHEYASHFSFSLSSLSVSFFAAKP